MKKVNSLDSFTTEQMKVMVYDISMNLARMQEDLKILNQEISNRELNQMEKQAPLEQTED